MEKLLVCSSVADDGYRLKDSPGAYEWWYFDALSDDGKDAFAITFFDNSIDSPRYNSRIKSREKSRRFPAVSFLYFRNGKAVCSSTNEFSDDKFEPLGPGPGCRIGESTIVFDSETYGSGYLLNVSGSLPRGRRFVARLEFLLIESSFLTEYPSSAKNIHVWNMAVPRADVTGKIRLLENDGHTVETFSFRGTGYHDHNMDERFFADTVGLWHRGRAHFADSTAVFARYSESGAGEPSTRLMIVRDGELFENRVSYEEQAHARSSYGIRYPTRIRFSADDGIKLRVKTIAVADSSLYYIRTLNEMTLTLRDGIPRKTTGISEFLKPRILRYRLLNWLTKLGVNRLK
ncbi:MAG: hypothetical protein ACT4O9_09200 [Blastocatellia bacterium]